MDFDMTTRDLMCLMAAETTMHNSGISDENPIYDKLFDTLVEAYSQVDHEKLKHIINKNCY
jgi:hypothetical protein